MNSRFFALDVMRGFAALLVFAGHLRALTVSEYHPDIDLLGKGFYFITGLGHQCVIIFFVLSGFFITKSVVGSLRAGRWTFVGYGIDRLSRLWTVLIPALVITWAIDRLGLWLHPDSPVYLGQLTALPNINPTEKSSFGVFLGNLFFLQEITVPTFGSNGPLWSLSYEFWYYVLFPLIALATARHSPFISRFFCTVLAAAILLFVGKTIASYFLIWLTGSLAYFLYQRNTGSDRATLLISVLLFILVLAGTRAGWNSTLINEFSLGLSAGFLVLTLSHLTTTNRLLLVVARHTSSASYTIYLVHLPISILVTVSLFDSRAGWSATYFGTYLLLFTAILLVAYLVWFLFERHTPFLKAKLKSFLLRDGLRA
jgi:peptidoglycan/LPS O-acetylase OafA/YrhL